MSSHRTFQFKVWTFQKAFDCVREKNLQPLKDLQNFKWSALKNSNAKVRQRNNWKIHRKAETRGKRRQKSILHMHLTERRYRTHEEKQELGFTQIIFPNSNIAEEFSHPRYITRSILALLWRQTGEVPLYASWDFVWVCDWNPWNLLKDTPERDYLSYLETAVQNISRSTCKGINLL